MKSSLAPVVLFVYNRPDETRQVLEALANNDLADQSDLFIFSDGPKSAAQEARVHEVRQVIGKAGGFKNIEIVERDKNFGLAHSVITGVSQIINEYGRVAVFEDDLISSPYALRYLNATLDRYAKTPKVFTVTAYSVPPSAFRIPPFYLHDVYFSLRNHSYAWGIWKDRWNQVDWSVSDFGEFLVDRALQKQFNRGGEDLTEMLIDQMEGRINSWSIRVSYCQFKRGGLTVMPVRSYIRNIGYTGGTHGTSPLTGHANDLSLAKPECQLPEPFLDDKLLENFRAVYRRRLRTKVRRRVGSLLRALKRGSH